MNISFSKRPTYEDELDNVSVDISIYGDKEVDVFGAVETFISFMQATGYSRDTVTTAFEVLLLED